MDKASQKEQTVHCEAVTDSGQILQCEVLTGSGENLED